MNPSVLVCGSASPGTPTFGPYQPGIGRPAPQFCRGRHDRLSPGWARRVRGVDWLGEDLLLLALDAGRGRLERTYAISYGLMGAELVRLAACGRIGIVDDQVVVKSPAPTGDAELDAALAQIGEPPSPPRAGEWVQRVRPRITGRYLERLMAAGAVCEQTRFGVIRWPITNTARLAEARQRLDLIAWSAGPVDLSQTAYASLACAIGLDRVLTPAGAATPSGTACARSPPGAGPPAPALATDSADAAAASPDASSEEGRAAVEAATLATIRVATYAVAAAAAAATARAMPDYPGVRRGQHGRAWPARSHVRTSAGRSRGPILNPRRTASRQRAHLGRVGRQEVASATQITRSGAATTGTLTTQVADHIGG
jgi:golgi phosphoprotein 3